MKTKTRRRGSGDIEKDYLKLIKRVSRELYGFSPARTHRNRKKYNRTDSRKELKRILENQ